MSSAALLVGSSPAQTQPYPSLPRRILLALDSSDHANAGMRLGVELAGFTQDAMVTGLHVYAAKLHDMRFRQMEGGLPEQFREEEELERQRVVHDDLITRGLSIISDAYLDQAEAACRAAGVSYRRCSREGKNYRELASEANVGDYDLLIMGAMGLGATQAHQIGTVCRRVARRAAVDTLIVKEPGRALSEGPIVVAVDGSPKSYGGLLTGLALARHWQVPVKVVAAFDPYYHYVAFNRIAGVLSEQAGKVFRFKEQEKLHEEIIDSGLARIYQGHLEVAQAIAQEYGQP
ncbi:MAG: universal stress protein, partial [Armatimonadetes bacterium]|nr:universal stress protein [Armatimonadota bacterium]